MNHAHFYPPDKHNTGAKSYLRDILVCGIIDTIVFDIGVQPYSNINFIINYYIYMTQPSKIMVTTDKLLLDEVNKKQMMSENQTVQPIDSANIGVMNCVR